MQYDNHIEVTLSKNDFQFFYGNNKVYCEAVLEEENNYSSSPNDDTPKIILPKDRKKVKTMVRQIMCSMPRR